MYGRKQGNGGTRALGFIPGYTLSRRLLGGSFLLARFLLAKRVRGLRGSFRRSPAKRREAIQQRPLSLVDLAARRRQIEPLGAIDLRKTWRWPLRGGHSISNVLLRTAAMSTSNSAAKAWTNLPPRCRISPSDNSGAASAMPSSSENSRRAACSGYSSEPYSPFGIDHAPRSFLRQYGPPGCTSSTSSRPCGIRNARMPALREGMMVTTRGAAFVRCLAPSRIRIVHRVRGRPLARRR
jgi:hypothetical protein